MTSKRAASVVLRSGVRSTTSSVNNGTSVARAQKHIRPVVAPCVSKKKNAPKALQKKVAAKNKQQEKKPRAQEKKRETAVREVMHEKQIEQPSAVPLTPSVAPVSDEIAITLDTGRDTDIQSALLSMWRPPRGVRVSKACVIRVYVGKGCVEGAAELVQSSGSAAFDMAARRALLSTRYPHTVWNRTMVIHFS